MQKILIHNLLLAKYRVDPNLVNPGCAVYYLYETKSYHIYFQFADRMEENLGFIIIAVSGYDVYTPITEDQLKAYTDECLAMYNQIHRMYEKPTFIDGIILCAAVVDYIHDIEWSGVSRKHTQAFLKSYELLHRFVWLVLNRENALKCDEFVSKTKEINKCPLRVEAPAQAEVSCPHVPPLSPKEYVLTYLDELCQNAYALSAA